MHKNEFIPTVNRAFGSGGMFCTLTDVELTNYLMTKVMAFMKEPQHRILTAVGHVGQQEGSPSVFILSAEVIPQLNLIYTLK